MHDCQCWFRSEPYIKREARLDHFGGSFILVRVAKYVCKRCHGIRREFIPWENEKELGTEYNLKSDGTIEGTRKLTLDELLAIGRLQL